MPVLSLQHFSKFIKLFWVQTVLSEENQFPSCIMAYNTPCLECYSACVLSYGRVTLVCLFCGILALLKTTRYS